ncbi:hypothetical protein FOZ60_009756 [Perkinsus olseni]|uniref:Secreted protein n=1 Tax=Perkinsus olseni TaxID=32597 RepID=A0A7J6NIZ3_PEROL|nr:hypothetical protein FOZ60_009756 [Perkinsus olseni]
MIAFCISNLLRLKVVLLLLLLLDSGAHSHFHFSLCLWILTCFSKAFSSSAYLVVVSPTWWMLISVGKVTMLGSLESTEEGALWNAHDYALHTFQPLWVNIVLSHVAT